MSAPRDGPVPAIRRSRRHALARRAVVVYDGAYRLVYGLNRPASEVGPALRVTTRIVRRHRALPDGTLLIAGSRVGSIHLNNQRVGALHANVLTPLGVGLAFRRQLVASLRELAAQAVDGQPLADVVAFEAVTIFHQGLMRLGFVPEPDGLRWPRLVAAYQRALLASLHPAGALRLKRPTYLEARRLWLSRPALLRQYSRRDFSTARDDA